MADSVKLTLVPGTEELVLEDRCTEWPSCEPHPQHIKLHYEGLYTEVGGGMEKDKWSVVSPFSNPILLMSCPMGMCGQLT